MLKRFTLFTFALTLLSFQNLKADHSVARLWNEALLEAIRGDYARPTVHARNLFHTSVVMYDAWAVYDTVAQTYFLGKTRFGYTCPFNGLEEQPSNIDSARQVAISHAAYTLLSHRFKDSPGAVESQKRFDSLMVHFGLDKDNLTIDYTSGPVGLGNYLAQFMINYGLQDGANERNEYVNRFYQPSNPPLIMADTGNPDMTHPNRWQPLTLKFFIDQAGNPIPVNTPDHLSPEWGTVLPFSMQPEDSVQYWRDSAYWSVYNDPGPPPMLDTNQVTDNSNLYKWGNELVAIWSAHLDHTDTTTWDISPASIGNFDIDQLPDEFKDYDQFYRFFDGGDVSTGRSINPSTGMAYPPQKIKRADYGRVLAEFWADGPDSETPPGHWFTILNYVNDHPLAEKKFKGQGPALDNLEWDVKSYFLMGGTMHDAAISAWSIKGYYDYVRPVSAIRRMAELGQSSDMAKPRYHPGGIRLYPGYIELVQVGDPLAGANNENVNEIKLFAWRGPDYIPDSTKDVAGVGWILAGNWWPYQRPSFVTPPFAGYVSGHSTYSRAAAEVMTQLTGDEFFPGGVGEFYCQKNKFLVFEDGPSEDVTLQWATYRDASDQCSLSRIWGGIHPPADDIPGRKIGEKLGMSAFVYGEKYFEKPVGIREISEKGESQVLLFPNPVDNQLNIKWSEAQDNVTLTLFDVFGSMKQQKVIRDIQANQVTELDMYDMTNGVYVLMISTDGKTTSHKFVKR